jgi:hypothetical protein
MRFSGAVFRLRMRLIFQLRRSGDKWSIASSVPPFLAWTLCPLSRKPGLDSRVSVCIWSLLALPRGSLLAQRSTLNSAQLQPGRMPIC